MHCKICGLHYVEDSPTDQKYHRAFHDPIANGVYGQPLTSDSLVWSDSDLRITVIHAYSPRPQQVRAGKTARVARRDTPFDISAYGPGEGPDQYNVHVFLLHCRNRIIGLAAFRLHLIRRQYTWIAYEQKEDDFDESTSRVWTVDMIWVHKQHRGKGYAHRLLEQAMMFFDITSEMLGWSLPFTDTGKALAKSVCPERFIAAG